MSHFQTYNQLLKYTFLLMPTLLPSFTSHALKDKGTCDSLQMCSQTQTLKDTLFLTPLPNLPDVLTTCFIMIN